MTFWAVGQSYVKVNSASEGFPFVLGKEIINGGCYGDPAGAAVVLAGCLTTDLTVIIISSFSFY